MDSNIPDSLHFLAIDQRIVHLNSLTQQFQDYLANTRHASIPDHILEGVSQIESNLAKIRQTVKTLEFERKGLLSLFQVSQYINSSLDLEEVLCIAMDIIVHLTQAERGFLMLVGEGGKLSIRVARNWEQETINQDEWAVSRTVVNRVVLIGEPVLTTDAQEDPRFNTRNSISVNQIRSILCVPIKLKGHLIGVLYADHRLRSGIFTGKERDLLLDFSHQAAVAIENARLFESVRNTLAEVKRLKTLTDRVFASIASGVMTIDNHQQIVLFNQAAERILNQPADEIVGKSFSEVFPELSRKMIPHIQLVFRTKQAVIGVETNQADPLRGIVELRFNISPLKDARQHMLGVAIVVEDLTEIRQLEAQRRLFARMVSPAVVAHLDPHQVQLGGQRSEISLLFTDLRGFTPLSEAIEPEHLVAILNQYLAVAVDAVMKEDGTVDKFLGDAVMAWFNAPIPQPDHALRAVRAALAIRSLVTVLHLELPEDYRLLFGTGIHTGEAILGLIGTEQRSDYTAIGDCVNVAKRIQESAAPGQILISEQTYRLIADDIEVKEVEPVVAKGKREPICVYEVVGLNNRVGLNVDFPGALDKQE